MDNDDLLGELRIDRGQREDHRAPRRWPWIFSVVVILILAAGAALAWWLWAGKVFEVQTATAVATSAATGQAAVLEATGYVTARRQATVSAQITGTLTDVLIEEGERVEKGQILARLEDSAYRAGLDAAKARAAAARAQVAQSEAQLTQAQRDFQRQQDLVGSSLVSQQAADQARTEVAMLEAQVNAQQRQAAAAAAEVEVAQVQFDYTVVRAPFAGVIVAKAAQVGEIISPLSAGGGFTRTGVGTIVDMDSLEIEVDVNESYINRVKPNMPVLAVLDAYPDWEVPGHVIAIIPTADRSKATVRVRIAIEDKDPRIVPEMGVRVTFLEKQPQQPGQAQKGVLVPASAIVERAGNSVVFVIDGDTARQREVAPAPQTYGDLRLLPSGVAAGDTLVDEPPADLLDGSTVETN
ncbi:MAG: efflux RND transporter periplasmic adaptor subunit [Gammaproteobacteria bacterium]|nr:efflux RND transporter periplasmic adaptor subunit [Gammaproteobacteria bacterium]